MNAPATSHPALQAHAAVPARQGQHALPQAHVRRACGSRRCMGQDMLVVEREALRALAEAAFSDINHLSAAGRICKQLRTILDDPEASDNDKFVAYDFLKNANIAAGGVLPMCQDTGTAIIMGKKGRLRLHRRRRRGGARRGRARRLPEEATCAIRSSRRSRCSRRRTPSQQHAGAGRDLCRGRRRLQVPVHRQGRRLGQQDVPVPGDAVDPDPRPPAGVPEGEGADARHRGVPALSPGDRDRRHLGRADA